jgi:2-dehydro-3-deoxyphosphogalactonate aldolase
MLNACLSHTPLIAILRGITPDEAALIGTTLYTQGFRCIEVPLNSPQPLASIAALREALPDDCLVGAGTVLQLADVGEVKAAGGNLIVMPHSAPDIIRAAKQAGMLCAPGVGTPTEGMAALACGADALKLFPAEQLGPAVVKAWRSVFPPATPLIPVGGMTPERMSDYWKAGANGFGIGSALYAPSVSAQEVERRARSFVEAARALATRTSNTPN